MKHTGHNAYKRLRSSVGRAQHLKCSRLTFKSLTDMTEVVRYMREDASTFEFNSRLSLVDMSQVRVLLSVLNVGVLCSSHSGVTI